MGRDDQTDAGRKGTSSHKTKESEGTVMPGPEFQGDWLGAYGGGLGSPSSRIPDSDGDTDGD